MAAFAISKHWSMDGFCQKVNKTKCCLVPLPAAPLEQGNSDLLRYLAHFYFFFPQFLMGAAGEGKSNPSTKLDSGGFLLLAFQTQLSFNPCSVLTLAGGSGAGQGQEGWRGGMQGSQISQLWGHQAAGTSSEPSVLLGGPRCFPLGRVCSALLNCSRISGWFWDVGFTCGGV